MIAPTRRSAKLPRMFCAIFSLTSLLWYFGGAEGVFAAEAPRPLATFNARVEIDIEDGEVEVWASFTRSASGTGLDLSTEAVGLEVKGGAGAYSITIPPGSFKKDGSGVFRFQRTINKVKVEASIRPSRDGAFDFEIQTEGANLKGFANPVTLSLSIGGDGGTKTVRAKIE